MTVLKVQGLSVHARGNGREYRLVDALSYEVEEGEILGIVGESGCGKTTANLAIMDLLPEGVSVSGGSILFGGEDLIRVTPKRRLAVNGNEIAMIYQEPLTSLNPLQRIGRQAEEPLLLHHPEVSPKERKRRCLEALEEVGLPDAESIYRAYPHQLSGGMRQRVCIAMAIICRPRLLIADEPTTALDVTVQKGILELLRSISRRNGMAVVFVSHDLSVVRQLCSRVLVMYAGRPVEEGETEDILDRPAHEYTKGLIRCIPKMENKGQLLHGIPGHVPAEGTAAAPCPFADRCGRKTEICLQQTPPRRELGNGHAVYCWRGENE